MEDRVTHDWVRTRLGAWRTGLLTDDETSRLESHVAGCAACRAHADAFADASDTPGGRHVPPAVLASWPRARGTLRGLERALVRRHLERCAECRQDLEALGHSPALEFRAELETGRELDEAAASPQAPAAPNVRIVRFDPALRTRRERVLFAWGTLATAAAVLVFVFDLRARQFDSRPLSAPAGIRPTASTIASEPLTGLTLRIAPKPRSLSGPVKDASPGEGKLNVIPVAGALTSLALGIKPLNVPDTSLVTVSLLDAAGRQLFAVQYRQWEFEPRRMIVIDRENEPLTPGQYAVVLASEVEKHGERFTRASRYRFELRAQSPQP